jgi:peptidoglycan lytic transglycosylase
MPQRILRACAAPAALAALAGAIAAGTPAAHPATAHAADAGARPAAGDVSIARRRLNVTPGRHALVSGRVAGTAPGRAVALERRGRGGHWHTVERARTGTGGAFRLRFRPRAAGSAMVRVRTGATHARVGRLNVFRRARASWYGPGLYGGHLGCGGTLTPGTLGVASKTLPCGAKVTLRHRGRTVRVPVVDRGPYVAGREFDLTAATKDRLRFGGAGSVLVAD